MSFKTASAILRGNWLLDKQWANAHMPLVISFMRGDASAAKMLLGDDEDKANTEDKPHQVGTNVFYVFPGNDLSALPKNTIAVVDIDGPLFKAGDVCTDGMEDYASLFYSIQTASNISGVIVDIDSPGGQADGTASFATAIKSCAAVKPVIGFVDDGICASAAYWALSACTEIYCSQPTDEIGSIGVYCTIADWNAYYAAEGLPIKDVYAPESTEKNIEVRESLAGNDDLLKAQLSVTAEAFISAVKTNRKGKLIGTDWSTGKLFFAADAIAQGLIEGVKTFDQIILKLSRMASNKNKTNTMAFEKTLTVADVEAFEVVDGGFLLGEQALNNIEAALTNTATLINSETAETIANFEIEIEAYKATGITATQINQTLTNMIVDLEANIAAFGKKSSGTGTKIIGAADANTGEEQVPSYLDDNSPINQFADLKMRKRK